MDPENLIDLTPLRPQRRPDAADAEAGDSSLLPGFGIGTTAPPVAPVPHAHVMNGVLPHGSFPSIGAGGQQRREDLTYIWGTNISVEEFSRDFRTYLEDFELSDGQHPHPQPGDALVRITTSDTLSLLGGASSMGLQGPSMGGGAGTSRSGDGKFYLKELLRIHLQGRDTLEVNFTWMQQTAPRLYNQIVNHPTECLTMMAQVAAELSRNVLHNRYGIAVAEGFTLNVAPKKMPELMTLKLLSPQNVEQLLSIRGMVIRVTKIIPELRVACFQCWNCMNVVRSDSEDKGRIFEPTRCNHCGKSYFFRLQHNLSIYEDKQLIKVQEAPENVSDGETPVSISAVVYGNMVDAVVPGDRVAVTGIYRSVPIRLNANTRIIKSIFSTHIDVVHIELVRATRLSEGKSSRAAQKHAAAAPTMAMERGKEALSHAETMDTERLDMFHRLAHRPDIYEVLLNSFARTIWGHDDVKRGILAQLFGGTPKTFVFSQGPGVASAGEAAGGDRGAIGTSNSSSSSNKAFFRSEINVILCGDPGVAKSQLLTQVHEIAPRGVYTSGKGSSSVGLTAYVVRDSDTGELVLEPGALVLSDQGLCCIDEFDKMNEATRSVLHEVMEQQTLSIAKAGIIAQLNARTAILAAANPKESQWNMQLNIVENLQIEPTLLSRFDLIFLLLDRHDPQEDRRLASHVLSLYMDKSGATSGSTTAAVGRRRAATSSDDEDDSEGQNGVGFGSTSSVGQRTATRLGHNTATTAAGLYPPQDEDNEDGGTAIDVISGQRVDVHMQYDGEVFLQGPSEAPYMPSIILSEYIAVARETVRPKLTAASHKKLATCYVDLRRARGSSRTVSATLRQLESMIRLAEARAKMRYSSEVSERDVDEAKRLISEALKEAATDPKTGRINLDMFHAPDTTRNTVEGNMKRLEELIATRYTSAGRTSAPLADLRMALNEHLSGGLRPMGPSQFVELLAVMAGGAFVKTYNATTVTFADPSNANE